jgi:tryptophanyl-tRNA synthetase
VFLFDEPEVARKKIMAAVTDSGSEIKLSPDKPGITNLLGIYAEFSGISAEDAESKVQGLSYSDFKGKVADVVTEKLKPLQEKYAEVRKDDAKLLATLQGGAQKAREISNKKLDEIYEKVGFVQ